MQPINKAAIDKEAERSALENSAEMRERERVGLRKPMRLSLSDEWCIEMARRELELDETAALSETPSPQDGSGA